MILLDLDLRSERRRTPLCDGYRPGAMKTLALLLILLVANTSPCWAGDDPDAYSDGIVSPDSGTGFKGYKAAVELEQKAKGGLYGADVSYGKESEAGNNLQEFVSKVKSNEKGGEKFSAPFSSSQQKAEMKDIFTKGSRFSSLSGAGSTGQYREDSYSLQQFGLNKEGGLGKGAAIKFKVNYASPVELLAVSGYNIVYDQETIPLFELTPPMKDQNVLAVLVNSYSQAKSEVTGFSSIVSQLNSLQNEKGTNFGASGSASGASASPGKSSSYGLSAKVSQSKSSTMAQMNALKKKTDSRFARVTINLMTAEVKLTRNGMMLSMGFLEDLKRLPVYPHAKRVKDYAAFLKDPENKEFVYQHFRLFDKYGTNYRRVSRYGGSLQFVFKSTKTFTGTEESKSKTAAQCMAASGGLSFESKKDKKPAGVGDLLTSSKKDSGSGKSVFDYLRSFVTQKQNSKGKKGSPKTSGTSSTQTQTSGKAIETPSKQANSNTASDETPDDENQKASKVNPETSDTRESDEEPQVLKKVSENPHANARAKISADNIRMTKPSEDPMTIYDPSMSIDDSLAAVRSWTSYLNNLRYLVGFYEDDDGRDTGVARELENLEELKEKYSTFRDPFDDFQLYSTPSKGDVFDLSRFVAPASPYFSVSSGVNIRAKGNIFGESSRAPGMGDILSYFGEVTESNTAKPTVYDNRDADYCLGLTKAKIESKLSSGAASSRDLDIDKNAKVLELLEQLRSRTILDLDVPTARTRRSSLSVDAAMSFSSCMAAGRRSRNIGQNMDEAEDYDIQCKGGEGCDRLLFSFKDDPDSFQKRMNYWAARVWKRPVYLESDPLDFVLLHEIFEDSIHWKYVNSTEPRDIANVTLDRIARKDSLELGLSLYFTFYALQMDASFFCADIECSSKPYLSAVGDCVCADSECELDLLSRAFQAGGAVTTGPAIGARMGDLPLDAAQPFCPKSQFWDQSMAQCSDLLDKPHICGQNINGKPMTFTEDTNGQMSEESIKELQNNENSAGFVNVRSGGCTKLCGEDEAPRVARKYKMCKDQRSDIEKSQDQIAGISAMVPFYGSFYGGIASSIMGMFDGPQKPKVCSTDIAFCVPLCGGETYLHTYVVKDKGDTLEVLKKVCVKKCPSPYKADPKSFKCVANCLPGQYEKEDTKTGNTICTEDCGIDIAIDAGDVKFCIKNTVLGFYNVSISLASFPSVSCAKGSVYRNNTGWMYFGGQGRVVSHPSKASVVMVTSVNIRDLKRGYGELLKLDPKPPVLKSYENADGAFGCIDTDQSYPTGNQIHTPTGIGDRTRLVLLFDNTDMNYLVIDQSNFELRKARKDESPQAFIFNGGVGGRGGICLTDLLDNDRCRPIEYFSNRNSTITGGLHSSGNFEPFLHFNEVTKTLRLGNNEKYGWRTFLEFHVLDKVTKPYGSCAGEAMLMQKATSFPVSFPSIKAPCRDCKLSTFYSGYGFVTGGIPLLDLKVNLNQGRYAHDFFATYKEGSKASDVAFALSSVDSRCFIACTSLITECKVYCATNVILSTSPPLEWQNLEVDVIMKMLDFYDLAHYFEFYKVLQWCDKDWTTKNTMCSDAINWLGSIYRNADSSTRQLIERNVKTRDYAFYTANPIGNRIKPEERNYIGREAINYASILQRYIADLRAGIDRSSGSTRARTYQLLKDIKTAYNILVYDPKYGSFERTCKSILLEYVARMHHLKNKLFSLQLVGTNGKSPILLHMCIGGQTKIKYNRRSVHEAINVHQSTLAQNGFRAQQRHHDTFSERIHNATNLAHMKTWSSGINEQMRVRRQDQNLIVEQQTRSANELLDRINVTWEKPDPKKLCNGDSQGFFCMTGYNYTELVVIEFTLHHDTLMGGQGEEVSDVIRHVCPIKREEGMVGISECRSPRFNIPPIEGVTDKYNPGYLMFIMDFENYVLRFDLFVYNRYLDQDYLTYISHGYADQECFSGNICYGGSSSERLLLRRRRIGDQLAPGVNNVHISSLKMHFNDTEYFQANPFAAYVRPCNVVEMSNPLNSRKLMLASYVRFNYANRVEYQDVLFVYLCNSACERRTMVLNMQGDNVQDSAEFQFPDMTMEYNKNIESSMASLPGAPKEIVLRYSEDLAADKYTLDLYNLHIDQMEYILSNLTLYYGMLDNAELTIRGAGSVLKFSGFLSVLNIIRDRLTTAFYNVRLGNSSKPHTDPFVGETYRLSRTPGDLFARMLSELKVYYQYIQTIEQVMGEPESVVSIMQKNDAQNILLSSFDYVKNELRDIEEDISLGLTNGTRPLTWEALSFFFENSFRPEFKAYRYLLITLDTWVVQIDRRNATEQIHCITRGGRRCLDDNFVGAFAQMIIRYEMNTFTGDIRLEVQTPCEDKTVRPLCRSKWLRYIDMRSNEDQRIYSTSMGDVTVTLTSHEYRATGLSSNMNVNESWYSSSPDDLNALYKATCGVFYDLTQPLIDRNCTCLTGYDPVNCRCSTARHQTEDSSGNCVCNTENHFAQVTGTNDCACDRSKFFVKDPSDPNSCICDPSLNRVYDSVKDECRCNEDAGFFPMDGVNVCKYSPSVLVKVTSVRKVNCASGFCFDFSTLECTKLSSGELCRGANTLVKSELGFDGGSVKQRNNTWSQMTDAGTYQEVPKDIMSGDGNNVEKKLKGSNTLEMLEREAYKNQSAAKLPSDGLQNDPELVKELTIRISQRYLVPTKIIKIGESIISAVYPLRIPIQPSAFLLNSGAKKLGLSTITDLEIDSQPLSHIPESFFSGLGNARRVKITNAKLSSLAGSQAMFGLTSATELDLSGNNLKAIGYNSFDNTQKLSILKLNKNQIKTLDTRIFCLLESLERLEVDSLTHICLPVTLFNSFDFKVLVDGSSVITPFESMHPRYKCSEDNVCGHKGNIKCRSNMGPFPLSMVCHSTSTVPDFDPNDKAKVLLIKPSKSGLFGEDAYVELPYSKFLYQTERESINIKENDEHVSLENFKAAIFIGANIPVINVNAFQGLYFLDTMIFEKCQISFIEPGAFRDMTILRHLGIVGNNIDNIADGTFSGLKSLKVLNLQGNQITTVEQHAFQSLGMLEDLNLEGNLLSELDSSLFESLPSLQKLRLSFNGIRSFPKDIFSKLSSIREIELAGNKDAFLDDVFVGVQTSLTRILVDLTTIVCLPYRMYSYTNVYPMANLVFCTDDSSSVDKLSCPPSARKCPKDARVCRSDADCNRSRFKGGFNYCSPEGKCVCSDHLGGPYCNIPLGHLTISVSSFKEDRRVYNIPLYRGSLKLFVPSLTERLVIVCPYIDNIIFNDDLFQSLTSLKGITLKTIYPVLDTIIPDDNFFATHPQILSEDDIIFQPIPAWKGERQVPQTYRFPFTHVPYIQHHALSRRQNTQQTVSPCKCVRDLVNECEYFALQSMKPERGFQFQTILRDISRKTSDFNVFDRDSTHMCGFGVGSSVGESVEDVIVGKYVGISGGKVVSMVFTDTIQRMSGKPLTYRLIVIVEKEAVVGQRRSVYERIISPNELYDFDIIVDSKSEYWPETQIISGRSVIVYTKALTGISPPHFSSLYEDLTTENKKTLYFNYFPARSLKTVCEPNYIFLDGVRVNNQYRECFNCNSPSECEYLSFRLTYAQRKVGTSSSASESQAETALTATSKVEIRSVVWAFGSSHITSAQKPLCSFLSDALKSALQTTDNGQTKLDLVGVDIRMSGCNALKIFSSTVCTSGSDSDKDDQMSTINSFSINHITSTEKQLCSVEDLDLRCIHSTIAFEQSFYLYLGFVTDKIIYIRFGSIFLQSKASAEDTQLPPLTALILEDSVTKSSIQSAYLKSFKMVKGYSHCQFKVYVKVAPCSKQIKLCHQCQRNNYESPCFTAPCVSHITGVACTSHGTCVGGRCLCDEFWTGPDCSIPTCGADKSGMYLPCSGSGQCDTRSYSCLCDNPHTGNLCNACRSSIDCLNGGLCEDGKCKCTELFGGPLCQYHYVSIRYAMPPFVNRLQFKARRILLKPFMISEPVSNDPNAPRSAFDVTALEINLLLPKYDIQLAPIRELPAYMLYGLENLRFLNISGLVDESEVFTRGFVVNDMIVSARILDTVKNLRTLIVSANQTLYADNLGQYSLRGLNVWMKICRINPTQCKSKYLARTPFPLEIYSRARVETQSFAEIPLESTSWHVRMDDESSVTCDNLSDREKKDASLHFLPYNKENKDAKTTVSILLIRRNFLAKRGNVQFLPNEVRMKTANIDPQNVKKCDNKDGEAPKGILSNAGSSIWTGETFGYGTFRIKFSFLLSCDTFPVIWLISRASMSDPVFSYYHPDCLGTIQLFGASDGLWYKNDGSEGLCSSTTFEFQTYSTPVSVYNMFEPAYFYSPPKGSCVKKKTKDGVLSKDDAECVFSDFPKRTSSFLSSDNLACRKTSYLCSKQKNALASSTYTGKGCRIRSPIDKHLNQKIVAKDGTRVTMEVQATVTKLGMAIHYEYFEGGLEEIDPMATDQNQSGESGDFGAKKSSASGSRVGKDGESKWNNRVKKMLLHANEFVPMPTAPWHINIGMHSIRGNASSAGELLQVVSVSHAPLCKPSETKVYLIVYQDYTQSHGGDIYPFSDLSWRMATQNFNEDKIYRDDTLNVSWMNEFLDQVGIEFQLYFDEDNLPGGSKSTDEVRRSCSIAFVPSLSRSKPTGIYRTATGGSRQNSLRYLYKRYGGKTTISREEFGEGLLELGIIYNGEQDIGLIEKLASLPTNGCASPVCSYPQ
eukprot:Nk52_evm25s1916 gene=Nk52_evmTU25s1916